MAADLQSFAADKLAALTRPEATADALDALIGWRQAAEPFDPEACRAGVRRSA